MKFKFASGIAILVFLLAGCEDPYKNSTFTAFEQVPAATYLKSHPETFSLWSELIDRAGMFNTLNLNTQYTIFAPNDSAMSVYMTKKGITSIEEIAPEDAIYLIKYHLITSIAFDQSQFENGAISRSSETDDDLTIEFREGGLNAIYLNGEARFVTLDIEVTNGVIHEIESVLTPITASVYDILSSDNYSLFKEAIDATGYNKQLEVIYKTDTIDGKISSKRYGFTVFAVTDSVYNVNGITNLSQLNTKLGTTGTAYTDLSNALNIYISYHLLGTLKSTSDLSNLIGSETSTNINTLATNQIINLRNENGGLVLNKTTSEAGVPIVNENIIARNGVIHEVGGWLPVSTPDPVKVVWDLADQADIAALCEKYQREDLTGGYYNREFTEGELTSYSWKSSPEGRSGVVSYRNNRNNDGVYFETKNRDHMRFYTGPSGYVDATTPVLLKGKYKITMSYVSYRSTGTDGTMIASIDGIQLGSQLVTSNQDQDKIASSVLIDAIEFDATSSHTFRIVGIDGKLLALDYLIFEPVE